MNEHKFRAYHKGNEKFVDIQRHFSFTPSGELYQTDFKNIELMQYTGLKDKNGVEIYEGDIVKMDNIITGSIGLNPGFIFGDDDIVYIAWDNEIGAWSIGGDNFDDTSRVDVAYRNQVIQLIHQNSCEVIGNIYENKELLK